MSKLKNLAKMTTATTGTGTITLGSAMGGFLSFAAAGVTDGMTVTYVIQEGFNTEIGRGVYTSSGTTLSRSVLRSTNSNTPINLAGAAVVIVTAAAEDFDDIEALLTALTSTVTEGLTARGQQNMLYNPGGRLNQRGASSVGDDVYGLDRWYTLVQTAAIAVSSGAAASGELPYIRLSQSQASAQRMGIAQILENADVAHLQKANGVTLSGRVRCSAATTIRFAVIAWTGTADTVTSDVVNSWTNGTFTAGQFFISTGIGAIATGSVALSANTWTDITALVADLSGGANNVIVFVWTDSTQAQNVTLDMHMKLEEGGTATPIRVRPIGQELKFCERYYEKSYDIDVAPGTIDDTGAQVSQAAATAVLSFIVVFKTRKRTNPTVKSYNTGNGAIDRILNFNTAASVVANYFRVGTAHAQIASATNFTAGQIGGLQWTAEAEL